MFWMKKYLIIVIALLIVFSNGCSENKYGEAIYDNNYELNKLILGLSYVPDSNDEYRKNTLTHLEALNINKVRMGQNWRLREPIMGEYYMQPVVDRLNFYADNNIDVLMTIDTKSIPEWARELDRKTFITSYRDFIKTMLNEYGQHISYIQFGNEWDWEIDKYLDGDTSLFIEMNNILYDEVMTMGYENRPIVVLGSISIGGLRALAFNQDRIENVYFDKEKLYSSDDISQYEPMIIKTSERTSKILKECKYDIIDIHLYDDYWNWHHYVNAINHISDEVDIPIIVSEFGGPDPDMEPQDDKYRANQLYYYVKTLEDINIEIAYYFKLHEHTSRDTIFHPYSYLIDRDGNTTETYETLRKFGE